MAEKVKEMPEMLWPIAVGRVDGQMLAKRVLRPSLGRLFWVTKGILVNKGSLASAPLATRAWWDLAQAGDP